MPSLNITCFLIEIKSVDTETNVANGVDIVREQNGTGTSQGLSKIVDSQKDPGNSKDRYLCAGYSGNILLLTL